ncbi:MAG: hypothetical protein ACFFDY_11550 [Candidatus Thorarchaeota archaeon]
MSKSSGLAVLALIIALGALGIGVYQIFFVSAPPVDESGVVNTWHNLLLNTIDVNSSYEPIDQLNTSIEVNSGEWVYVSFAGNAKLDPIDTLRHSLILYFAVDGDLQTPGFVYEEILDNAAEDDVEWIPISFYAIFKDLDPGTYVISIYVAVIYNTCPAQIGGVNSFMGSSLLIQTLIP